MSSPVLAKENLTAYQRWELATLTAPHGSRTLSSHGPVSLPTAADIEAMQRSARDEGLAEGRQEAAARATQLQALLGAVTGEVRAWEEQIAEDVVSLALEIARQVVRETPAVRREAIVAVVRDAMQEMPLFGGAARLLLNPADAAVVREEIGDSLNQLGWKVVEDERMERNGCRIEGAATRVDATVATRWERVSAALGHERSWLERPGARRAPEAPRDPA